MKVPLCHRCGERPRAKRKNGFASYCKPCVATYNRERRSDPEKMRLNTETCQRRAHELQEDVDEIKRNNPCIDCGRFFNPWQMQFDHVRGKKFGNISEMAARGMANKLRIEMKKCEIVCACCHADRTYRRTTRKRKRTATKVA